MALAFLAVSGCANVDRKMDLASEHISTRKPMYEGRLVSSKVVGALTSLQFADGQLFGVSKAPSQLIPGDIIRIYQTESGYEAHLWHASKEPAVPPGVIPSTSTVKK